MRYRTFVVISICAVVTLFSSLLRADVPIGQRPVDRVKVEAPSEQTVPKIVGGKPAKAGEFPFQVALIVANTPVGAEFLGQFCGGTLIDKKWVLTAAHCVPNTRADEVDIFIGSNVLPSGGGSTGERLHLKDIISHPHYNDENSDNDIALLLIDGEAPAKFVPARLATPEMQTKHGAEGSVVTVVGWGATSEDGNGSANLLKVDINVQDSTVCESNYRQVLPTARITGNMFCAGRPKGKVDSCQGDSGGFIGVPTDKKQHLVLGIVSWGVGCARPGLFGVYTRVGNYSEWVESVQAEF